MKLELVSELTPPLFREVGVPERVFEDEHSGRVLVVSRTSQMYWPGRTLYSARPAWRLCLYDTATDGLSLIASHDHDGLDVNDVAFHPSEHEVVLATGQYDGGYSYDGQLLRWRWEAGEVRPLLDESRCVTRARFEPDGTCVALLTARDDGELEDLGLGDVAFGVRVRGDDVTAVERADEPIDPTRLGFATAWRTDDGPSLQERDPRYRVRAQAWDVAWLDDATLALAHAGARVEVFRIDGEPLFRHDGPGCGVELVSAGPERPAWLNVWIPPAHPTWEEPGHTELFALDDGGATLRSVQRERGGSCSASTSSDGSILLRRFLPYTKAPRSGRFLGPDGGELGLAQLDAYDVFNHALKIDGADALLALVGKTSEKWLAAFAPDGRELTRSLIDAPDRRVGHAAGAGHGERFALSLVGAGARRGSRESVVTVRDADTLRVRAEASIPGRLVALSWALDGRALCAALHRGIGTDELVLFDDELVPQHRVSVDAFDLASSPTCIAARDERVAIGTSDGRLLLYRVRE